MTDDQALSLKVVAEAPPTSARLNFQAVSMSVSERPSEVALQVAATAGVYALISKIE